MKLSVWQPSKKEEPVLYLRLVEAYGPEVHLVVEDGKSSYFGRVLLEIDPKRGVHLCGGISLDLDLPIDADGRLKQF